MEAPRTKAFGPARIVALALISLTALGLAYLHFAGNDSLSVPSGAQAGQLTLHSCNYATEKGSYRADCGTLVVHENRHKAHSRLIALPVTRIHARSANPGAPILRLQGGPGLTNMKFEFARRLPRRRRLVEARLPRGDIGALAGARPPEREVIPGRRSGIQGLCTSPPGGRRRPRRLHPSSTRRRPRRRPPRAGLRAHRPRQRERRDAHGHDLQLALPEADPPLGDDRRQSAR